MRYFELFLTALKLGCISFGGPVAHLGFFHEEYVVKKKWLTDSFYADLVAISQFLPGPASSQVGMAVGYLQEGIPGAILCWLGFTLPSAIILMIAGMCFTDLNLLSSSTFIHGLKIAAVPVVAHALWEMAKKLTPDRERVLIALLSAGLIFFFKSSQAQFAVLILSGLYGYYFFNKIDETKTEFLFMGSRKTGFVFCLIFFSLLLILPGLRFLYPHHIFSLMDSFYRAGSLVFGGGHVVLPMLQAEVTPPGWVSESHFMAGYGLSNAIPGPLFAFSAYLGFVSKISPNGWIGGFLCLIFSFLPAFLLIVGVLPFWDELRKKRSMRKIMQGLNAGVVGLLLAALYHPVITSSLFTLKDFVISLVGFFLLQKLKWSSWIVVSICVLFFSL